MDRYTLPYKDYLANTTTLLPGAAVQIISSPNDDTAASGITSAINLITNEKVDGLVGSTYSVITTASSILSAAGKIPQCDGSSTSPDLSNKALYPYFFRTVPSDHLQGQAIFQYIYLKGWRRVSLMYETGAYGNGLYTVFTNNAALKSDFTIVSTYQLQVNPTSLTIRSWDSQLADMKKNYVFVIAIFGASSTVRYLPSAATAAGMKNSNYAWIGADAMYDTSVAGLAAQEGFVVFNPSAGIYPCNA